MDARTRSTRSFHFHYTPRRGACGKPRVVPHNGRTLYGDVEARESSEWSAAIILDADVIIVGAGPTGLMLAGELVLAPE